MLVINFKNYSQASGQNGAKQFEAISRFIKENPRLQDKIFVAPNMLDLLSVKSSNKDINVISQHVDNKDYGSTTGWIPVERLLDENIEISILNHGEHRIENLEETINALHKKGMKLIVCCENNKEVKKVLELKPFAIALEPSELIGTGDSVTNRPDEVKEFVSIINGQVKALIGAGVSTKEDVKKSLQLGADGVLLASAFVKADDHYAKIKELVSPFLD